MLGTVRFLDEKDMEYFKRKEAEGDAVIIHVDPEALLDMDIEKLYEEANKDKDSPAGDEKLMAWLREQHVILPDESEDDAGRKTDGHGDKTENRAEDKAEDKAAAGAFNADSRAKKMNRMLKEGCFSPRQAEILTEAMSKGISEEDLVQLFECTGSEEHM